MANSPAEDLSPSQDYMRFCRDYRKFEGLPVEELGPVLDSEFGGLRAEEREYILASRQFVNVPSEAGRQRLLRIADTDVFYLNLFARLLVEAGDHETLASEIRSARSLSVSAKAILDERIDGIETCIQPFQEALVETMVYAYRHCPGDRDFLDGAFRRIFESQADSVFKEMSEEQFRKVRAECADEGTGTT